MVGLGREGGSGNVCVFLPRCLSSPIGAQDDPSRAILLGILWGPRASFLSPYWAPGLFQGKGGKKGTGSSVDHLPAQQAAHWQGVPARSERASLTPLAGPLTDPQLCCHIQPTLSLVCLCQMSYYSYLPILFIGASYIYSTLEMLLEDVINCYYVSYWWSTIVPLHWGGHNVTT